MSYHHVNLCHRNRNHNQVNRMWRILLPPFFSLHGTNKKGFGRLESVESLDFNDLFSIILGNCGCGRSVEGGLKTFISSPLPMQRLLVNSLSVPVGNENGVFTRT